VLIKQARSSVAVELLDGGSLKTAGVGTPVQDFISTLKPERDITYALVSAMSYSEFFGPNSNHDYYGYNPHIDFNGLLHSWSDFGRDPKLDAIKARDWPHGYPCFYAATVYAHHRNTDPKSLGFGDVIYVYANPHMRRIELVERIFEDEAKSKGHGDFLRRIADGARVDVSMGAKVPFDACSRCTDWERFRHAMGQFKPDKHRHVMQAVLEEHKRKRIRGVAETRAQYCECMRLHAGKVMDDGQLVFVYNDAPRFFDISKVIVGADRTSRVMWSLPSAKSNHYEKAAADCTGQTLTHLQGIKVASIKKEDPDGHLEIIRPNLHGCQTPHPHGMLAGLARIGVVASPAEFSQIVVGKPIGFNPKGRAGSSFSIRGSDILPEIMKAIMGLPRGGPKLEPVSDKLAARFTDDLAGMYVGYRLSLLQNATELLSPDAIKIASDRTGFLLPSSIVVEWTTAHLSPDHGSVLGSDLSHLLSMIHTTKDLEKVGNALDGVLRVKNTSSLWTALGDVASVSPYL
jgi:hypothetical protein